MRRGVLLSVRSSSVPRPGRSCATASWCRSAIAGFLLLSALLSRPGEVLTKSDLIDATWQGAAVEETNLSVQIAALRKQLGQSPNGGDSIATIPRVGYRFIGPVERRDDGSHSGVGTPSFKEPGNGPSIAVLPFVNLSDDREQEYFADGMVEEIITALSRLRWLFVIARNSSFTYKGRTVDVKQVGRELGVRYVLEGSVRKAGNKVRIAGQLIDTSTGAHLWADRFEYDGRELSLCDPHLASEPCGPRSERSQRAQWRAACSEVPLHAKARQPSICRPFASPLQVWRRRQLAGDVVLVEPARDAGDESSVRPSAALPCARPGHSR